MQRMPLPAPHPISARTVGAEPLRVGHLGMQPPPRRSPRTGRGSASWCAVMVGLGVLLSSCGAGGPVSSTPASSVPTADAANGPVGPLRAPGGPALVDRDGRTVLLHGVDLVYKIPPYEVEVQGSGRNVLTAAEARRMAQLGFTAVRLGVVWKGLEPGAAPVDAPAFCTAGRSHGSGPDPFDPAIFDSYMTRLEGTISLLARNGIFSLIDMHQDVYNEAFGGEGAPDWAVCTDGITPRPQRNLANWSMNYTGPGVAQAYGHLWNNDVVGDLQGRLDALWAKIASRLRANPWVIGYDPFNEPYGAGLSTQPDNPAFDAQLECFYTGRAHPGLDQAGQPLTCPADDPEQGLIPRSRPQIRPTWSRTRATTAPTRGCRTTSAPWTTRDSCSTSTTTASCTSPTVPNHPSSGGPALRWRRPSSPSTTGNVHTTRRRNSRVGHRSCSPSSVRPPTPQTSPGSPRTRTHI